MAEYPELIQNVALKDARVCRVFLSSPFVGLEEERVELTKLMPAVRQVCSEHGVELAVVDMRWGITEESAAAARTVHICLQEVDRSDVFVGFYSQRYGWNGVNDKDLQANLDLAYQTYPWIDEYRDRAVTELEYIHAHLNNPGCLPSIFCFRDPNYDQACLSEAEEDNNLRRCAAFRAESDQAKTMLDDLKQRVIKTKDKCIALKESYTTPKEMADYVYENLLPFIRDVLLKSTRPAATSETDIDQHDVFRISRCRLYIGDPLVEKLDMLVTNSKRVLVHGTTGSGKSALVSNWLQYRLQNRSQQDLYAAHFVGFAPQSANIHDFLKRLIKLLTTHEPGLVSKEPVELDDCVMTLSSIINNIRDRQVFILVDGLDKFKSAKKAQKALFWLPRNLPDNCHVILTMATTDTDNFLTAKDDLNYRPFEVESLSADTKRDLASELLRINSKDLPSDQLNMIISAEQTDNPLYLLTLIKELCVVDYYKKIGAKIIHLLHCSDVTELFSQFILRLETDYNTEEHPDAISQVLSALCLLKNGIRATDISKFCNLPSGVWVPIQYAILPYLVQLNGYYTFEFPELSDAVRSRYLTGNPEYSNEIMKKLAHFMWTEYKDRFHQGIRQENMLINAVDIFYKIKDQAQLRAILGDLHTLKRLYQIDRYLLLEYWQSTGLDGPQIAKLLSEKIDEFLNKPGNDNRYKEAVEYLQFMREYMAMACYYKGEEILLYKTQKVVRESNLPDETKKEELETIHHNLACLYSTMGKDEICIELHQKLLKQRLQNPNYGSTVDEKMKLANTYHGLATAILSTNKNLQKAYDMFDKCLELYPESEKVVRAGTINCKALVCIQMDRFVEAQKMLEEVVRTYEEQYFGEPPTEYGSFIMNLALAHRKQMHLDEAEQLYKKCLAFNERILGSDHLLVAKILMNVSTVHNLREDLDGALKVSEKAMEIFLKHFPPDHYQCLMTIENVADCHVKMDKWEKAEPFFWKAFEIRVSNQTIERGLKHLYEGFIIRYINRLDEGDVQKTIRILENVFHHFDNPRYYGILAIADSKLAVKPARPRNMTLDFGLEKYPHEMFNIDYKFRLDIMTDSVNIDRIMSFVNKHQANWMHDGSFILSVATWLIDSHQRYDLASPVLQRAVDLFPKEQNILELTSRAFKYFASQNDYAGMLPLITRLADLFPDTSQNQLAAAKVSMCTMELDLARKYCRHILATWPEDDDLVQTVTQMMELAYQAEKEAAEEASEKTDSLETK